MAGPVLQLFPPPPRPHRQMSPNRSPNRKNREKSPAPQPVMKRTDSAQAVDAPADFHELIIKVNSVPVSPVSSIAPPASLPGPPPRAHIANSNITRTPPTESRPTFDSPARVTQASPSSSRDHAKNHNHRARTPSLSTGDGPYSSSPKPNRSVSPAFSTTATLVRPDSAATQRRPASPEEEIPMRSMFPVYDPTVPLPHQLYKPTQTSPTHLPQQTQISRAQLSTSPNPPSKYIPYANIAAAEANKPPPAKPFFTPSHLLDNLWVACNGQEDPAVQMYTLRMHRATAANPTITFGTTPSLPFYSLAQSNLAGEHEIPTTMNEVLIQRHHPSQPRVLPIAQLDLMAPPSLDTQLFDPHQQEPTTLLTSIYPKLAALAALDAAANSPAASHIALMDPGATSPAAQRLAEDVLLGAAQRECCALAWTRDSPEQQSNPWARHMPSEGTYQLHHPTLGTFPLKLEGDCSVLNIPSTRPMTTMYGHNMPSTPPVPGQKTASITILNPYILSPTSPRATAFSNPTLAPPPAIAGLNINMNVHMRSSITPSEMDITQLPTATDATTDDAVLARLDFSTDALSLNLAALSRFGNPFLVDVIVSALLAVAVAEAVRGRKAGRRGASPTAFDPPPPSSVVTDKDKKEVSDAQAFGRSFVDGFNAFGGGKTKLGTSSLRKWSLKSSGASSKDERERDAEFDKDIELGEWYGQGRARAAEGETTTTTTKKAKKAKAKQDAKDEKLPFVTRTIISVLTFAFKAVVFVLRIAVKVVAGVVVMITRNIGRL